MGTAAEVERLAALRQYGILDTAPDTTFNELAKLAAMICGTPIALISFVDEHRHWFKAHVGTSLTETARGVSLCAHAMRESTVMVVPDTEQDVRFANEPLVIEAPIRFYAGAPLISASGQPLGALCVLDHVPRVISEQACNALQMLARQVMVQLEAHRRADRLSEENALLVEHHRLGRALRASDHRWQTMIAAEPECVKLLDRDGHVLEMNPAGLEMIGASSLESIAGRCVYDLVVPAERALFRELNERVFLGESGKLEFSIVGYTGRARRLETHAVPMRDELGAVQCALSITRDITANKAAEDALRAADQERADLIDAVDGIVWEADAETFAFTFVSHQAERLLGYPVAQWCTERGFWAARLHPEDRAHAVAACTLAVKAGEPHILEYRMVAADGSVVWLHDSVSAVIGEGPSAKLRGLMVDITERKAAESAFLANSERHARQRAAMTELTRSRVLQSLDLTAALREITQTAAHTLGVARVSVWRFTPSRSAIVCHDLFDASTGLHTAGLELAAVDYPAYFHAISTSEVVAVDAALTDPRTCEFATAYLGPLGIFSMLDAPIQADGEIDGVLCHEQVGSPRVWMPDELSFAVSVANLVSLAIAQSERREMEKRFRQSQKMEAFGQLAGGVAHDFNNILMSVMMQANDAATIEDLPPYARDALIDIELATARGASLTRQLLAFSRRQVMQSRAIDLNVVVNSLTHMLRRVLGADVTVEVLLDPDAPITHADPGMMDQVLMNLALNARDAMPGGGEIRIETLARTIGADEARAMGDTQPGRYVCLRVTDNGCGISADDLTRIFEPFFTTKEPGKGTGLGLATVFGIVKQHRGVVQVTSELGRGAAFTVMLPATDEAVSRDFGSLAKPRGGTETILVVEDEPQVRRLLRVVLERRGYRVLEAGTGEAALGIWDQAGGADALLTDMVMPGMSGRDLAARLQERSARLKVIFISGYSPELAGRDLVLREGENFLQKPCSPDLILATLRRSLDGSRSP